MSEWRESRFLEIATVIMGQSPASEFYNSDGNGLPFMQGNRTFGERYPTIDTYTTQATKIAPQNSILMSVRAPVGDINIAPLEMCIGRGLCAINAKGSYNEFVRYLLSYNMPRLKSSENGTTFTAINGDDIKKLKILIPDLPTQKRIADILSAYDDLIENNNRRIALLEKAAQELYKEWFVRFRFPGYENAKFENGLPEGWERKKISVYYDTCSGGTPSRTHEEYFESGIYPWVKTGEIKDCIIIDTDEYITEEAVKKSSAKLLPAKSVAMAMYGVNIGQLGYFDRQMTCNQACCVFSDKRSFSSKHYLFQYLKSIREYLLLISFGAAQQNLSQELIKKIKIVMPSDYVVRAFEEKFDTIYDSIKTLMCKNQNLAKQRDLLLPRLMNGKLEVKKCYLQKRKLI